MHLFNNKCQALQISKKSLNNKLSSTAFHSQNIVVAVTIFLFITCSKIRLFGYWLSIKN